MPIAEEAGEGSEGGDEDDGWTITGGAPAATIDDSGKRKGAAETKDGDDEWETLSLAPSVSFSVDVDEMEAQRAERDKIKNESKSEGKRKNNRAIKMVHPAKGSRIEGLRGRSLSSSSLLSDREAVEDLLSRKPGTLTTKS